jgi:hypothetical protein
MNRRSFLSALIISPAAAALLAACGDNSSSSSDPTSVDPSPTVPTSKFAYPTGADDVVLRIGFEGGFMMQGAAFIFPPTLLVSGDGRLFVPGATTAIYPGPLLSPVFVRTITPAGIDRLLQLASDAGLLTTPPDYSVDLPVADAGNTVVQVSAKGSTYVHSAFALGLDIDEQGNPIDGLTPERAKLKKFVDLLGDYTKIAGEDNLGPEVPFEPAAYRFQAFVVEPDAIAAQEPEPTLMEWPASTGVKLADAVECARIDAAAAGTLFTDALQNTYFTEAGVTYSLAVGRVLPGDPAC